MSCEINHNRPITPIEAMSVLVLVAFVVAFAITVCGCRSFYENAGAHVRTGSVTAPVEFSEPTSSINIRALYAMDGIDFYAAKNANVKMDYTNEYTNTYFGIIETKGRQSSHIKIEPTADINDLGEAEP